MEQSAQNADQNMALSLLTQGQAAQQGDQQRDAMLQRVRQSSATAALRAQLEADAREAAARSAGDARARAAELALEGVLDRNKTSRRNNQDSNDTGIAREELRLEGVLDRNKKTLQGAGLRGGRGGGGGGGQPPVKETPALIALRGEIRNLEQAARAARQQAAALEANAYTKEQKASVAGLRADAQELSRQAAAKSAELANMEVSSAYTNMGSPSGAPKTGAQSDDLQKAMGQLEAARARGTPQQVKFAEDKVKRLQGAR